MNSVNTIEKPPVFPGFLSTPFRLVPAKVHSRLLVTFLNRILKQQILEGELDFLENKRLCVQVTDIGIQFHLSLIDNRLVSVAAGPSNDRSNDIHIQACAYDFLQLAARQQDPDTLVFQRRLVMQGNTELGLELKNFLDALDLESSASFVKIEKLLIKSLPVYKRIFS
jgi:O2-independent ubiquinone biosynthesis accessory factor UbiT